MGLKHMSTVSKLSVSDWLRQVLAPATGAKAPSWLDELDDWLADGARTEGLSWTGLRQAMADAGWQLQAWPSGQAAGTWAEGVWLGLDGLDTTSPWVVAATGVAQCPPGQPLPDASTPWNGALFHLQSVGLPQQQVGSQSYWQWVAQLLQGRLPGLALSGLLINLGALTVPLFSMLVYDKVVHNGIFETLWALAIGVLLFLALELSLRHLRARQVERLAQVLDQRVDAVLFRSLLQPGQRAGSQPGMTARFVSLYRDLASARDFFSSHYLLALADLPFMLLLWLVMGWIAWPLLLLVLAWTAVYALWGTWLKEQSQRMGQHTSQLQTRKFALLADALSSLDALRTSHVGPRFQAQFAAVSQDHGDYQTLLRHAAMRQMLLGQAVFTFSYVSLLVLGAYLVFQQQMTQGALVAVAMLSGRTLAQVAQALMTLGRWRELQDALKALHPFLVEPPNIQPAQNQTPARAVQGDIKVLQVGHGYGGQSPALKGVTLHIRAGERVALMGRPGSGKSTLARVLAHAIAPSEGEVRVDDVALSAYGLHSRADWLSFKPQETALVAGTVESNILAALSPLVSAQDRTTALQRALYLSGMDQDLAQGTLSLSQSVEEYGANLSGGQRQKVALARALAVPTKVLILDEPTNGLDPESEKQLVERLAQLQGTTLILVSHSARALSLCPRVIALDRGRVVADGATRDLVKVDPLLGAAQQSIPSGN
jgi:ABC-type bacteriocin/lantibiotic exporter with double-glycine peptidase domain